MKKLYEKNELTFALVWIGLYVVVMNIALQFCGGFDDLASKTALQVLVPVICICVLAVISTVWIIQNGLSGKYGLCRFKGSRKQFLYFIPLVIMSCVNLKNGLGLNAPGAVVLLMMVNLAVGGYVEEIIFRGFLFRAMAKDNLRSAILVSAITFGAGHIVNLANTADTLGVLLQVCYAIVIGFLYTLVVYKGGSLWPVSQAICLSTAAVYLLWSRDPSAISLRLFSGRHLTIWFRSAAAYLLWWFPEVIHCGSGKNLKKARCIHI